MSLSFQSHRVPQVPFFGTWDTDNLNSFPNEVGPPPQRRPNRIWPCLLRRLLGCGCRRRRVGLGILATEPLNAAGSIHQALLAGKERVTSGADFHVNVALVGRPGLKVVSTGALNVHGGIIGMDFFLGHLF